MVAETETVIVLYLYVGFFLVIP